MSRPVFAAHTRTAGDSCGAGDYFCVGILGAAEAAAADGNTGSTLRRASAASTPADGGSAGESNKSCRGSGESSSRGDAGAPEAGSTCTSSAEQLVKNSSRKQAAALADSSRSKRKKVTTRCSDRRRRKKGTAAASGRSPGKATQDRPFWKRQLLVDSAQLLAQIEACAAAVEQPQPQGSSRGSATDKAGGVLLPQTGEKEKSGGSDGRGSGSSSSRRKDVVGAGGPSLTSPSLGAPSELTAAAAVDATADLSSPAAETLCGQHAAAVASPAHTFAATAQHAAAVCAQPAASDAAPAAEASKKCCSLSSALWDAAAAVASRLRCCDVLPAEEGRVTARLSGTAAAAVVSPVSVAERAALTASPAPAAAAGAPPSSHVTIVRSSLHAAAAPLAAAAAACPAPSVFASPAPATAAAPLPATAAAIPAAAPVIPAAAAAAVSAAAAALPVAAAAPRVDLAPSTDGSTAAAAAADNSNPSPATSLNSKAAWPQQEPCAACGEGVQRRQQASVCPTHRAAVTPQNSPVAAAAHTPASTQAFFTTAAAASAAPAAACVAASRSSDSSDEKTHHAAPLVDATTCRAIQGGIDLLVSVFRLVGPAAVVLSFNGGKDAVATLHLYRAALARFVLQSDQQKEQAKKQQKEQQQQQMQQRQQQEQQKEQRPGNKVVEEKKEKEEEQQQQQRRDERERKRGEQNGNLAHCEAAARAKLFRPKALYFHGGDDEIEEVAAFVRQTAKDFDLDITVYRTDLSRGMQDFLKKCRAFPVLAVVLGTRRGDPNASDFAPLQVSDAWLPPFLRVHPLADFSYGAVWQFLKAFHLPYCSLYDRGYTSLGRKHDTLPNPMLFSPVPTPRFLPADQLLDWSLERMGRRSASGRTSLAPGVAGPCDVTETDTAAPATPVDIPSLSAFLGFALPAAADGS